MRRSFAIVCFALAALFLTAATVPQFIVVTITSGLVVPTGVVDLTSQSTIDTAVVGASNVDGVVIGARWFNLEPTTDGVFDFSGTSNLYSNGDQSFDYQLSQAEAASNISYIKIEISTGGPDSADTNGTDTHNTGNKPTWLTSEISGDTYAGGKFFVWESGSGVSSSLPVFWEPTLIQKHGELISAIATHLGSLATHPKIKAILVPWANGNTDDFNLLATGNSADGAPPTSSTPVSRWQTALTSTGYSDLGAALVDAGNQTFTKFHTAFPSLLLFTPINTFVNAALNSDTTGYNVCSTPVLTANMSWPGHIGAQKQSLTAGTPVASASSGSSWAQLKALHDAGIPVAAQMDWHAYADCTISGDPLNGSAYGATKMAGNGGSACVDSTTALKTAIDTGVTYGMKWIEIYDTDLLHLGPTNADPTLSTDIAAYGHTQLYHP